MHFSATSYIMAILGGNCLICFLCIIMRDGRIAQRLSIRFLKYFSFFILLRLILPFEFFHTITVPSEKILPVVMDFCNEHVFFTVNKIAVTPTRLFLSVWIGGVAYIVCSTVRKYIKLYRVIPCFPNLADDPDSKVSAILTAIYSTNPVHHPVKKVIRTRFVNTPCVIGFFSPVVFLPDLDFTPEELYCILFHELSHLRHMDFIWMLVSEILCIINWWNPFVALLRARLEEIMEFHADNTAFANLPPRHRELYLDCLLKVARSQQQKPLLPAMTMPFSTNRPGSLKCRILRLVSPESYKSVTNYFAISIAVLMLFASTLFIVEPSWPIENGANGIYHVTEDSYLLMRTDGTYEFYIDDEHFFGIITNRDLEEIRDLPVYEKNSLDEIKERDIT